MSGHVTVQGGKSNHIVRIFERTGKGPLTDRRLQRHFLLLMLIGICCCIGPSCTRPPKPSYEGYGYLIIAPQTVMSAVQDFAGYKESKGFLVEVVSLEEILNITPGDDDPEGP